MIRHQVIGVMYTRTCPLACAHCVTESSPKARGRMTPKQVRRYLPAIGRFARHVSFTGGEPLLFHDEIVELAADARREGLEVSVVTGAGWVKNAAMTHARMRELAGAGVGRVVVSWDAYHEAFIPRENALEVARAALNAGMPVDVRTVLPANTSADDYHAPFRGLPVSLESPPPLQLGAARGLPDEQFQWSSTPPKGACGVVLRPVIEPDGAVYACCGPGHFSRPLSPLVLGNAEEESLDEILRRGSRDPILEAISLVGPHGLWRLLQEGESRVPLRPRYSGVCELCLDINDSPELVAELRQRLQDRDVRMLLAAVLMRAEHSQRARQAPAVAFPLPRGVNEKAGSD